MSIGGNVFTEMKHLACMSNGHCIWYTTSWNL